MPRFSAVFDGFLWASWFFSVVPHDLQMVEAILHIVSSHCHLETQKGHVFSFLLDYVSCLVLKKGIFLISTVIKLPPKLISKLNEKPNPR